MTGYICEICLICVNQFHLCYLWLLSLINASRK